MRNGMDQSVTSSIFRFPLILKNILSHLPTPELLSSSLVCKAWNYESRCLLRDCGSVVAVIKGPDPCLTLLEFETLLTRMTVVPFTGLRLLKTGDADSLYCLRALHSDKLYPSILRMNPKYLQIVWPSWADEEVHDPDLDCAAILLLRKFLRLGQLEHLDMVELPCWLDVCSTKVMTELELPNLRVLKLDNVSWLRGTSGNHLIKAATNLNQLHMAVSRVHRDYLPVNNLKCVTYLEFHAENESDLEFFESIILAGAKLQKLSLYISPDISCLDRTWRTLRLTLESCNDSLKDLSINLMGALMLMKLQVSLDGLEKLEIAGLVVGRDFGDLSLFPVLQNVDYAELFPALKSVKLDTLWCLYREGELQSFCTDEELAQRKQLSWNYLGQLILPSFRIDEELLRTVATNFPNIRALEVDAGPSSPWEFLWELWPKLDRLGVEFSIPNRKNDTESLTSVFNLDAEFCGISPEEVAELQGKYEDFLEKIHIVPTRPAITHLTNLKALNVKIRTHSPSNSQVGSNNRLFLSKVTGFVAFRRMRGLHVVADIRNDVTVDFHHLTSFMNVSVRDLDDDDY